MGVGDADTTRELAGVIYTDPTKRLRMPDGWRTGIDNLEVCGGLWRWMLKIGGRSVEQACSGRASAFQPSARVAHLPPSGLGGLLTCVVVGS